MNYLSNKLLCQLWTPFELENWTGSLTEEVQNEPIREVFTHEEYISLVRLNISLLLSLNQTSNLTLSEHDA